MGEVLATFREALLYQKLKGQQVRCLVCQRNCLIPEGSLGYCATRLNRRGMLLTLIYGRVCARQVAPAEIKPLFHFHPGSRYLSLGSLGCNFRCPGCQNWAIAHVQLSPDALDELEHRADTIMPERAVEMARQLNCHGLSWTYNEPTLWLEYVLDGARLAKRNRLFTNVVTNGFMTHQALDLLGPYVDAYRVDIKAFSPQAYHRIAHVEEFSGILEVTERARHRWGMHVEVITNVIPGYNDDQEQLVGIARWILERLGANTPWHITRFHPSGHLTCVPPTPVGDLERARQLGLKVGLRYVYLGNVPGHPGENTYCPGCGRMLIERRDFRVCRNEIHEGQCPRCGEKIAIVE